MVRCFLYCVADRDVFVMFSDATWSLALTATTKNELENVTKLVSLIMCVFLLLLLLFICLIFLKDSDPTSFSSRLIRQNFFPGSSKRLSRIII